MRASISDRFSFSLVVFLAACALVSGQAHTDPAQLPANAESSADTSDAWKLPRLPPFQLPNYGAYPETARRMGLEGRVLVGFDIKADGRATKTSVIWSGNRMLESSVVDYVKSLRFHVPADWVNTGASTRWRLGFVYRLFPGSCQTDEFAIPVETIVITGSRLPGSKAGSGGSCTPSTP